MSDPLIAAVIGGFITILGWLATYTYTRRLEDTRARLQSRLQHRSQQIELLYGPLASLAEQVLKLWKVRNKILKECQCSPEETRKIRELIWKQSFAPLHAEINSILRTKLYLLEGVDLPESFVKYLEHSRQEECQHLIRDNTRVDVSSVPIEPWPSEFPAEVKSTLRYLMEDREKGLSQL